MAKKSKNNNLKNGIKYIGGGIVALIALIYFILLVTK